MRLIVSVSAVALASASPGTAPARMQAPAAAAPAAAVPPAGDDPFATPPAIGTPGAAPAAAATEAPVERDPLEKFNRGVWGFNQGVDRILLKPAAKVYRFVTPRAVRRGIGHVFSNLSEPWSFINNLLQLKIGRAANNLGRFVVNTTVGVGGLADHATGLGLKPTPEDFGQTLARYGVRHSAYLVLPVLGPSTVRDGIGSGVAFFADPYPICLKQCTNLTYTERLGIRAVDVVNVRSDLIDSGADAFLESSLDPYASARSAYLQRRAVEIADGDGETPGAKPASIDPTMPAPADTAAPAGTGTGTGDDPFATPPALAPAPGAAAPADPFATPPAEPSPPANRPTAERTPDAAPKLALVMIDA